MTLDTPATGATHTGAWRPARARSTRIGKSLALLGFDASWLYATGMACVWVAAPGGTMQPVVALLLVLSALSLFAATGLYRPDQRPTMPVQAIRALLCMAALGALVTGAVDVVQPDTASIPGWIPAWAAAGAAGSVLARLGWHLAVHRRTATAPERPAFVVGTVASLREVLTSDNPGGPGTASPVGVFVTDGPAGLAHVGGVPVLGSLAAVGDAVRASGVETVIIAVPTTDTGTQEQVLRTLAGLDVDGYLLLSALPAASVPDQSDNFGPYRTVRVQRRPLRDVERTVKRALDLLFGGAAVIVASPVLLAVAAAIKLDSRGPVLFKQPRYGYNDTLVTIYKFRTMYDDATDTHARRATTPDDPRVTPVGRVLRRTSMDELPQLFNVLQGRMSMVGPRPHAPESCAGGWYFRDAVPTYAVRHRVKPGITGAAQVSGWRGPTETLDKLERRVEHDLWYMYHWSPALDLKILLRTPFALIGNNTF